MKIDLTKVKDSDVSFLEKYYPEKYRIHKVNEMGAGIESGEHYKLLNYLATDVFVGTNILDVGTRDGLSCLALCHSKKNLVITYDILKVELPFQHEYPNATAKQLDILQESPEILLGTPLISFDIDPHDGNQEPRFFEILEKIGYKGVVILDDISTEKTLNYFPGMRAWWNSITQRKWDITEWGHGSGTGLVDFSGNLEVIFESPRKL